MAFFVKLLADKLGCDTSEGLSGGFDLHKIFGFCAALLATQSLADDHNGSLEKFEIRGTTLVYDTETIADAEIVADDVDVLLETLRANSGVRVLELNSSGGSVWAGREMARIVIDFGLDTIVHGECSSSCVRVFLAGENRQMTLGSKLGFHQPTWSAANMQSYYEQWRQSDGWDTPFDFSAWVFEDTQREFHEDLNYMISRGVAAEFAVKSKGIPNSDNWYPTRVELSLAGVLRSE